MNQIEKEQVKDLLDQILHALKQYAKEDECSFRVLHVDQFSPDMGPNCKGGSIVVSIDGFAYDVFVQRVKGSMYE